MDTHEEFLKFSAVLSHCYQKAQANKLGLTVAYGREDRIIEREQ